MATDFLQKYNQDMSQPQGYKFQPSLNRMMDKGGGGGGSNMMGSLLSMGGSALLNYLLPGVGGLLGKALGLGGAAAGGLGAAAGGLGTAASTAASTGVMAGAGKGLWNTFVKPELSQFGDKVYDGMSPTGQGIADSLHGIFDIENNPQGYFSNPIQAYPGTDTWGSGLPSDNANAYNTFMEHPVQEYPYAGEIQNAFPGNNKGEIQNAFPGNWYERLNRGRY